MPIKTLELDASVTATQWTEQARTTWQHMGEHVGALVRYYGETSEQARKAAMSYVQIASSIVGWGDVQVTADRAPLSLYCMARGLTFGIIWHGDRRTCTNDACAAYLHEDGTPYWYGERPWATCQARPHTPSVPLDAPMPGTWSFHS